MAAPASEYDDLVLRALAAYDAGRWDEARQLFERAHALDPTARTLRTIGMTAFNQGDFVGALQNLEAARVDPRKPLTDEQRAQVDDLIERASRRLGRYRLRLEPADATLLVDGHPPERVGEDELALAPGHHDLRASAPGYRELARTLEARGGDRGPLELVLSRAEARPATVATVAPHPDAANASDTRVSASSGASTWGWLALSVGAAGLIGSGVTFALALHDKSTLDAHCEQRRCPASEHDTIHRYDTLRLASGVALGAGMASAAVGLWLLLDSGPGGAAQHASAQPVIAPGYVGVRGRL